jgi:hypothetical protein
MPTLESGARTNLFSNLIENLKKDIGYLEAFEKASKGLKMPRAE